MEKSGVSRTMLGDSYKFQQFERDCNETTGWINEKIKVAANDNYLDPTNINQKGHWAREEIIWTFGVLGAHSKVPNY